MTTAASLFDLIYAALLPDPNAPGAPAPTDAGANIDRPGVLPTQTGQYPRIVVRLVGETKQSQGRGTIGFTTTAIIRIVAEASAPVAAADPQVSTIEADLWRLKRQIELAIVNSYPLFGMIQQLVTVQTQLSFDAQATMLAGVQSDFTFEFFEDEDDFPPPAAAAIAGFDVHLPPDPALTANPAMPVDGPGFSTTSD